MTYSVAWTLGSVKASSGAISKRNMAVGTAGRCRSDNTAAGPFPVFRGSIAAHASCPPLFRLRHRLLRPGVRIDRRGVVVLPAGRFGDAVLDGDRHLPVRDGRRVVAVEI